MNEIINKFLLAGDNFMAEIHSIQLRFTYSACEPVTKTKKQIQKFKEFSRIQNKFIKTNWRKLAFNITWYM